MVAVPEVGDDPASFAQTLTDAGYFDALAVTQEDRERRGQYQANRLREVLKTSATDLPSYLRSLEMQLVWRRFDQIGLARTVQLINTTNQFNLTMRRYSEEDVWGVMRDNRAFGLQFRLLDRFGDNSIISIVIGRMLEDDDLLIDTWLMSYRVLGRQVEPTTLNLVADRAKKLGARRCGTIARGWVLLRWRSHPGGVASAGTWKAVLGAGDGTNPPSCNASLASRRC
jgi:FkbH-like protein